MSAYKMILIGCVVLVSTACSVSQKTIEKHLVGTWICGNNDVSRGGMTFYPDGQFSLYQHGDKTAPQKLMQWDHYAKGRYKIQKDFIFPIVTYHLGNVSNKAQASTVIPAGEVTLRRQVKKMSAKQMTLVYLNKFEEEVSQRCTKVYEAQIGQHFNEFLKAIGVEGKSIATFKPKQDDRFARIQEEIRLYQEAINIINDSGQHRKFIARLLDITKKATPKNIRVMSIVGQDLHYQISGMADSEETVKSYVQNLQNLEGLESVTIAESHAFSIVSKKKDDKGSQTLFEFRVSLQFKSTRAPSDTLTPPARTEQAYQEYQKKLVAIKSLFQQESSALIRPSQLDTILNNLAAIAVESSVSFIEFKPEEQTGFGPVIELPVSIKVRGNYQQMNQFLKKLALDKHTIGLTGLQIEPDYNNIKSTDITLTGYINFFALRQENGRPLNYDLLGLEPSFPKKIKRVVKYTKVGDANNDPFHTFKLNLPKPRQKATQASIACQSNRNIQVHLTDIRYLGLLRQYGGNAALFRIKNKTTVKLKEGQCLNKSISITKIMRSKVIIKQTVADKTGRIRSRTVSLSKSN